MTQRFLCRFSLSTSVSNSTFSETFGISLCKKLLGRLTLDELSGGNAEATKQEFSNFEITIESAPARRSYFLLPACVCPEKQLNNRGLACCGPQRNANQQPNIAYMLKLQESQNLSHNCLVTLAEPMMKDFSNRNL